MLSPMQMRIQAAGGGEEAKILTNASVGKSNYDPRAPGVYTPAADGSMDVRGIYERIPQVGTTTSLIANFMFHTTAVIAAIESDDTKVRIRGIDFLAKMVRRRVYLGEVDGYSMELHRGGQ